MVTRNKNECTAEYTQTDNVLLATLLQVGATIWRCQHSSFLLSWWRVIGTN